MTNWNSGDRFESSGPDRLRHDRFSQLCALAVAGSLSEVEVAQLKAHLEVCTECRQAMAEFHFLAVDSAAVLKEARGYSDSALPDPHPADIDWSPQPAKRALLARIKGPLKNGRESKQRNSIWQLIAYAAAAMVLAAVIAIGSYRIGALKRQPIVGRPPAAEFQRQIASLHSGLQNETKFRADLENQIKSRDAQIEKLTHSLNERTETIRGLKEKLDDAEVGFRKQQSELDRTLAANTSLSSDKESLLHKFLDTEASRSSLRAQLESLTAERQNDLLQLSILKRRVDDLNARLEKSQETVAEQQDFLVSDRDIRELMGARNLYITDVMDVDKKGRTRSPYGRIFYTQGKSLIFYAFDLDQEPGFENAAFQLWGQRGADKNAPLNMGILYLDSEANRRWVLKSDDPKKLDEINAVFVTVEPNGGSRKPKGKELLYASLRTLPNHP